MFSPFGTLPTGEAVGAYTLANANGLSLQVIPYGATITSLRVPDREGKIADVVLGFSDLGGYLSDAYRAQNPYMGIIAGRVAGRLTGGHFLLEGKEYSLAINDPPNHLHGGRTGFDQRLWSFESVGEHSVSLAYRSPDGEEGYPGTVDVTVTYTITPENAVVVEIAAVTDRATPFNPTHHSYFNLAGEGAGSVAEHELQIAAGTYAPTDDKMTLLGRREKVGGNDFSQPRRLGDALPDVFKAHGDLYFLDTPQWAARVVEPGSGRVLTVNTTEKCLQFYSGVSLDGSLTGKSGRPYGQHAGLCLECHGYPDGVNTPSLGDIILRPGHPFRSTTIYAFSTI